MKIITHKPVINNKTIVVKPEIKEEIKKPSKKKVKKEVDIDYFVTENNEEENI